jgi:MFS family permease
MISSSAPMGPEFRALAVGEAVSTVGDQLAHLGVATLVFGATGSITSTALAYAATFLPDLVAGPLLSPLADRFARRPVMVACSLVQAAFAAVLALRGLEPIIVILCVIGIAAASAPFKAAQVVTVNAVLPRQLLEKGQNRIGVIREAGQLAGLAAAAAILSLVGTTAALLIDAASFVLVAALLQLVLKPRSATRAPAGSAGRGSGLGWRIVWNDPRLRAVNLIVLVGTLAILPDAVIIPLITEMDAPRWIMAPLLAADVVGFLIGAKLVDAATTSHQRVALVAPMLVVTLAPLAGFIVRPGPVIAAALLLASGIGAAYIGVTRAMIGKLADEHVRARVAGWMRTTLRAGQGLAVAAGGVLADILASPAQAIAIAGVAGTAVAVVSVRTKGWRSVTQLYAVPK